MKYLIVTLLGFISFLCNSQTIKGFYKTYPLKTNQGRVLSKEEKRPLTLSYLYSNNSSLQRLVAGGGTIATKDTVVVDEYGKKHEVTGKTIRPTDAFVYKNFSKDLFRMDFLLNGNVSSIQDSIPQYEWKLYDETKVVLGYTCKKATTITFKTGRTQNITAWYTEEIPISDGPKDYGGLPGLILEMEIDVFARIVFEKISLLSKENTFVIEPEKAIAPLTISQYNTLYSGNN